MQRSWKCNTSLPLQLMPSRKQQRLLLQDKNKGKTAHKKNKNLPLQINKPIAFD